VAWAIAAMTPDRARAEPVGQRADADSARRGGEALRRSRGPGERVAAGGGVQEGERGEWRDRIRHPGDQAEEEERRRDGAQELAVGHRASPSMSRRRANPSS
jgi:hypothetical protein